MIQRIQSIFLLIAGLCFGALFLIPFATSSAPTANLLSDQVYNVFDHVALMGLCILGGLLSLVTIFLFKNRGLQMKLGNIVIVAAILLSLTAIMLFLQDSQTMSDTAGGTMSVGIGLPVLSIVFAVLAKKYIKKDQNIVKSMDRLR